MSQEIHKIVNMYNDNDGVERIQIYAVTAMNECSIKERHLKYGIKEVLSKPVNATTLHRIVEGIFDIE